MAFDGNSIPHRLRAAQPRWSHGVIQTIRPKLRLHPLELRFGTPSTLTSLLGLVLLIVSPKMETLSCEQGPGSSTTLELDSPHSLQRITLIPQSRTPLVDHCLSMTRLPSYRQSRHCSLLIQTA